MNRKGIVQEVFKRCVEVPDRKAIVTREKEWSYKGLKSEVERVGEEVRHMVPEGGGVAVAIEVGRSAQMVISQLAVWYAGCCCVMIDSSWPRARKEKVLNDCKPAAVLCKARITPYAMPLPNPYLYLSYTSGSTGVPKAVLVREDSVLNTLDTVTSLLPPIPPRGVTLLAVSPETFDISYLELYLPLLVGGTVAIHVPSESPLVADIQRYTPWALQATPATWQLLLAAGWDPLTLPSTRLVGGETFPPSLAASLVQHNSIVLNLYGPTETTIWVSSHKLRTSSYKEGVPIGDPFPGNTFTLTPQPGGGTSFLTVRGVNVAEGYLHGQSFEGSYNTGDTFVETAEGLVFKGRKDSQVKVRGNRIELGGIESHALAVDGVQQAVAVVQGDSSEARIVLYVTPEVEKKVVMAHLAASLPQYMLPTLVHAVDSLPLNPSTGKVDRSALPDVEDAYKAPAGTSLPDIVQGLVSDLLDAPDFPWDAPLHPTLDSISIIILCERLEKQFLKLNIGDWHGISDGVPVVLAATSIDDLCGKLCGAVPELAQYNRRGTKKKKAGTKKQTPPLIDACKAGDVATVTELLAGGECIESADRFGSTAIHYAAGAGHLELCMLLVAKGADDRVPDKKSGRTTLHWAARQGKTDVCRWLVEDREHGVEVRAKDDTTPLQLAAWGGHIETCKWLMTQSANVMFINKWGCTAVHFASLAGELDTCKWLHSLSLDLSHANYQGHNALHKAAYGGHRELCEWLHTGPPSIPITADVRDQLPSRLAAKAGHAELSAWLLSLE